MDQIPQVPPQMPSAPEMPQAPQVQPAPPIELQHSQPQMQSQQPQVAQVLQQSQGGKKIWFWILIAAIIVAAIAAGAWYWFSQNKVSPAVEINNNPPTVQAPAVQTAQDSISSINEDLEGLNVESVDQNFNDIDKELDNL